MYKVVRIEIVEHETSWCLSSLDDNGATRHHKDLRVFIGPYDLREKCLTLAQERASILAYEEGLNEFYILWLHRQQPERIELMHVSMIQVDHFELKETDQAEMLLSGKLIRFAGWNGIRFERYTVISSPEYSLSHSPIYNRLFSRGQAVFYRLK
jgi:hypothetical protein